MEYEKKIKLVKLLSIIGNCENDYQITLLCDALSKDNCVNVETYDTLDEYATKLLQDKHYDSMPATCELACIIKNLIIVRLYNAYNEKLIDSTIQNGYNIINQWSNKYLNNSSIMEATK